MGRPRKLSSKEAPDEVSNLIRSRRLQREWSLAKLAHASGLRSPAYVFHIENGNKTPSEAVARRIASALGLDSRLLAAWARARGRADLGSALEASDTVRELLGRPAAHGVTDTPPDVVVDIPVLPEGADPDAGAIEMLRLSSHLLPPLPPAARLIGYRLSAHGARRVPELLHPGDCVVVQLGPEVPAPDAPCAIRIGGRVELARVRVREGAVYLPAPAGAADSGAIEERIGGAERVLGRVVLAFRRWL